MRCLAAYPCFVIGNPCENFAHGLQAASQFRRNAQRSMGIPRLEYCCILFNVLHSTYLSWLSWNWPLITDMWIRDVHKWWMQIIWILWIMGQKMNFCSFFFCLLGPEFQSNPPHWSWNYSIQCGNRCVECTLCQVISICYDLIYEVLVQRFVSNSYSTSLLHREGLGQPTDNQQSSPWVDLQSWSTISIFIWFIFRSCTVFTGCL